MQSLSYPRIAALTGLCWAILIVVGHDMLSPQRPDRDAAPQAFLAFVQTHHSDASLRTGSLLAGLGICLGVVFVAFLVSALRERNVVPGWLPTLALASGAAAFAVQTLSIVPALVAFGRASDGVDAITVRTLFDLSDVTYMVALVPFGIFTLAVSAASLRSGLLPRWVGAGGILTGLALFAGAPVGIAGGPGPLAMVLFFVWVGCVSVVMALRGGGVAAEPQGRPDAMTRAVGSS
jgi:Domain of unknown function (DUF4386)